MKVSAHQGLGLKLEASLVRTSENYGTGPQDIRGFAYCYVQGWCSESIYLGVHSFFRPFERFLLECTLFLLVNHRGVLLALPEITIQ